MLAISILIVVCIMDTGVRAGELSVTKLPFHQRLNEDYDLYWNFNSSHIMFKTVVRTKGYVGFGISPNGGMVNSDVVIGWVENGKGHFADRYAEGHYMPAIDSSQDWTLIEAKEEGEVTTLVFLRKLITCDPKDLPITNGTTRIIYSYSPEDPMSDFSIEPHGAVRRGTKSITFLGEIESKPLPLDVVTIDFLNINIPVPSADTFYRCNLVKLPPLAQKHHVIRVEPLIQAGHEGLVHHMVLYYCRTKMDERFLNASYNCHEDMPSELDTCMGIFVAWAVGGKAFEYPDHVGYSLGAPGDPTYFKIETHYNNPSLIPAFVDSSGFRIHLTKQIRQYDAGFLVAGIRVSELHVIPPYEQSFLSTGYCTEECISKSLGDQELRIFADGHHSHLLGRKMRTRHIRNGVELPPILEDNSYDFNYQQSVHLPEERILKKGDALIVECEYDSSDRTAITFGGLSTRREMCTSFLAYYPKISLAYCFSSIDYKFPDKFKGQAVSSVLAQMDWTNSTVRADFKRYIDDSSITDYCILDTADEVRGVAALKPNMTQTYQRSKECND